MMAERTKVSVVQDAALTRAARGGRAYNERARGPLRRVLERRVAFLNPETLAEDVNAGQTPVTRTLELLECGHWIAVPRAWNNPDSVPDGVRDRRRCYACAIGAQALDCASTG